MADDIVIKISGDVKNVSDAMDQVKQKSSEMGDKIGDVAKIADIAFAAIVADIGLSVKEYGESQRAVAELTAAMQAQGIYSKDLIKNYQNQAESLKNLTGISDETITKSQAIIQQFLGERHISEDLTLAIANLAAAKRIDLASAAEIVGKAIDGNTQMLHRYGVQIDDNLTKDQRLSAITKELNTQFRDQAAVMGEGLGHFTKLYNAVTDLHKAIGERLAPILYQAADAMALLINGITKNKEIMNLVTSLLAVAAAVVGVVSAISTATYLIGQFKVALEVARVATEAMRIATMGLVSATGLGLLVLLVAEIYMHWSDVWPRMQAIWSVFVGNMKDSLKAFGELLLGVFTFDHTMITKGLEDAKNTFTKGFAEYGTTVNSLIEAQNQKELDAEKKKQDLNAKVHKKYSEIYEKKQIEAFTERLKKTEEFNHLSEEQQKFFISKNKAMASQTIANEKQAELAIAAEKVAIRQKNDNQLLIERKKYGAAFAIINQGIREVEQSEAAQSFLSMQNMTTSHNETLKTIGKAASIAQISIDTAKSAMSIFSGFSTIPFIGYALGVAGAAAAVAFGAERIGEVAAAAQGGFISGGVAGVDSVPAMLMPGEFVVPTKNANEVINAAAAARSGDSGGSGGAIIELRLKDKLMDFVEAQIIKRKFLNISIQGSG